MKGFRQIARRFRDAPIRRKLRGIVMFTAAAALGLTCMAFFAYELASYRSSLERELTSLGDVVGRASTAALDFEDKTAAAEILDAVAQDRRIAAAMLARPDGSPLSVYFRTADLPTAVLYTAPLLGNQVRGFRVIVTRPVALEGRLLGSIVLVGQLSDVRQRALRYLAIIGFVLLVSLTLAYFLSSGLARVVSRPLQRLAATAAEVSKTADYSLREEPESSDEIGSLVASFNEMLGEIQSRDSSLRRFAEVLEERVRERTADLEKARVAAEAASRAKSAFLANMSHEMRTPLVGVIGYADLLLMADLPPAQREAAAAITRSGEVLVSLIDDLLEFSRIEADRLTLETEEFELRRALSSVVEVLSPKAREKAFDLGFQVYKNVPGRIVADQGRLRQVLLNLLGNAVKFTARGRVALRVAVAPAESGLRLRFTVQDTGVGIPSEALPTLFDPFTQVDTSNTRQFGGVGLGLAISRRIVEKMGGELRVSSVVGEGSIFWFEIPVEAAESELPRVADSVASEAGAEPTIQILVVEDNPSTQALFLRQLEAMGWSAEAVSDGLEALDELAQERYDLVLMDCQMPRLDGYEVTRRLRQRENGGGRLPVIAVTARSLHGDRQKCLAAGMDDYLTKPFHYQDLEAVVRKWLPGSGAVERSAEPLSQPSPERSGAATRAPDGRGRPC